MMRILILTHEYDRFADSGYMVKGCFDAWRRAGHSIQAAYGVPWGLEADVVFVHVDVSVVPEEFRRFAAQFPVGINRGATDIRKRVVSRNLLQQGDKWDGQVIVKSDLNFGGAREWHHNSMALRRKRPPPYPSVKTILSYQIYPSIDAVPQNIWADPLYVVERFLPERDDRGYWLRCWVFFGDVERCNRYCCSEPIVKGTNVIAKEQVPVPDELRIERERLGFDYGKFDFVVHDGQVVLLDANRTPSGAANISDFLQSDGHRLASGIDSLLAKGT